MLNLKVLLKYMAERLGNLKGSRNIAKDTFFEEIPPLL